MLDDGTIVQIAAPADGPQGDQWMRKDTFMGDAPRFKLEKWANNLQIEPSSNAGLRNKFIDPLLLPYRTKYIPSTLLWTEEQSIRRSELDPELSNLIRNRYATWIVEGGIDREWDDYLATLEKLGIDEYVGIYQTSYDHWAGK
jgi:putative aldouronate transport system substrate-binding protein